MGKRKEESLFLSLFHLPIVPFAPDAVIVSRDRSVTAYKLEETTGGESILVPKKPNFIQGLPLQYKHFSAERTLGSVSVCPY